MCVDTDLFGDVIVRNCDVELWLKAVVGLPDTTAPSRLKEYCKSYDVANKVALAKLKGDFYKIKNDYEAEKKQQYEKANLYYPTQYVEEQKAKPCPNHFHICDDQNCHIFTKRKQKEYSRKMYQKRKKARALEKTS